MAKASGGLEARAARASRTLVVVCAIAGVTLLITTPGAVASGIGATFAQAVEVHAPSNAGTMPPAPHAGLDGIWCTSPRRCAAVGTYEDSSGHGQAMAAAETRGRWGRAAEVTAPPEAAANPDASLGSISCPSPRRCTAVGSYLDKSGNGQAMAAAGKDGRWGRAAGVTAPANAGTDPNAVLKGISCPSRSRCAAVGTYEDSSGHGQAMAAAEKNGRWGQAVGIAAPRNAGTNPEALLYSISCTSARRCTAVGSYLDRSGHVQAMEATEGNGTWGRAAEVSAPPGAGRNPEAALKGISCTSRSRCAAVGQYVDSYGHVQAMAAAAKDGRWGRAAEIAAPPTAGANPNSKLYAVSCTSAGTCTAVGTYENPARHPQAMSVAERHGAWERAAKVTAPENAGRNPQADLSAISCTLAGTCTAVGEYLDRSGRFQAMAASTS